MVKETRQIFDVSDIKAIRLYCAHCGREAVQSIKATEVPKKCPFCNQDWENDYPGDNRGYNWQMVRSIQALVGTDNPRMIIRFEIDGEQG